MSSILTSSALIKTIKRRAFIPRSQETFQDEDFLEMATEEINIGLMEKIISARGDYLVYHQDQDLVTGKTGYEIPARAHGNKLREASIIDSDGNVIYELTQITLEEAADYDYGNATRFFLRNNEVVLSESVLKPDHKLRMWFYMRPNKLVVASRAATIDTVSATFLDDDGVTELKTLSFASLPKHFSSSIKYDITGAKSPNKIINYDLTVEDINLTTKTITFLAEDLEGVEAGDFVTLAEESIVPNIPTVFHPVVAQRVAIACLEAMGDEQNKQSAERKLAQMERDVLGIIDNRVEGAPKKIKNRFGTLNSSKKKW